MKLPEEGGRGRVMECPARSAAAEWSLDAMTGTPNPPGRVEGPRREAPTPAGHRGDGASPAGRVGSAKGADMSRKINQKSESWCSRPRAIRPDIDRRRGIYLHNRRFDQNPDNLFMSRGSSRPAPDMHPPSSSLVRPVSWGGREGTDR